MTIRKPDIRNLGLISFAAAAMAVVLYFLPGWLLRPPADPIMLQQYGNDTVGVRSALGYIRYGLSGIAILIAAAALIRGQARLLAAIAVVAMGYLHIGYHENVGMYWKAPLEVMQWNAVAGAVRNQELWSGTRAPEFSFEAIDGSIIGTVDNEGKFIVVNVWATWCGPCVWETPELIEFSDEHRDDAILIGISPEDADVVREFAELKKINYPLVALSMEEYRSMPEPLNKVRYLPHSFIIDRQGNLKKMHAGTISRQQLNELIADDYQDEIKPPPSEI